MTLPSEEYCRFRYEMRDTEEPLLFSDDFIKFSYDEAERQAAKIGKLLFDRTSYVCNIPLLAGVNSCRLNETVFEVARVTVFDGSARWTAKARDLYEYDMLQPDWRSMNFSETKSVFIYDSTIEIAGICDFDGTLNVECYRLPLQNASDADQFEISAQHHPHLIDWVKYLAYQTRDADTEQAEYAKIHEERFRAYFGGVAAAAEAAKGKQRKPDVAARAGRGATPAQLVDAFFAECGDLNYKNTDGRQLDAGWARSLIEDYINEAEYEACERLNIIFDSSSSICSISTNPATKSYLIDSKVVGIKSISFTDSALNNYDISYREKHEFAKVNPSFKSLPFTDNKSVFIDNYTLEIAGVPTSGTLHLEVYRTPLANASVSGQFEIPEKYHASLLDWVKYKAFSNPDADIYDEAKAAVFLARFEGSFGKKRELWISESIKTSLPVLASAGTALTPSYLFNLFIHECGGYSFKNADGFVYDAGWVRNLILGYIDEAEREACERTDLIYDISTAVCNVSVNTSSAIYSIDESVYFIKSIKFTDSLGNSFDVLVRNKNEFIKINSGYRSEGFSVSKSVFIENRTIELAGISDVAGTLHLEVYRTPLANASAADQFEIPSRYSSSLINWVKFKAFSNPDIDIYDEAKAAAFLARFEDSFGKRQERGMVSDEIKKSLPAIQSRSQRAITPSAAINLFIHECGGISFKNSDGLLKDAGWAESVLAGYLDEAEYEACERSNILFDKDTPAVCQIPVIAGQSVYPLHGAVTGISYVKFVPAVGSQFDVLVREKVEFGQISPAWRTAGFSANRCVFIHDSEIELAGIADAAGTLHLEVYRSPLANASVSGQFEIPEKYHAKLLDWVKYKAFANPDIDIYDVKKSYVFYGQFQRAFGKRRDRKYIADEIKTALPVSVNTSGVFSPLDLCNLFRHEAREKAFKNADGTLYDAGWRTDLLLSYADEAEREAAARADLIFDSTTEAICKISVTTGTKIYRIDSRINRIDNARFVGSGDSFEVEIVYRSNEYDRSESWASDDFSLTRRLFVDDVNVELSGTVSVGGDIILSVYRSPLVNASSSGLFEISERHQSKLLHWVAYRAYMSVDNDIYHDLSLYHLKEFERYFGYSKNQDAWRYSQRNEPLVTAYQGI